MAKRVTKLEDFGDERDQAVFKAIAELDFNGDMEAMIADYNRTMEELDGLERTPGAFTSPFDKKAEVRLKLPRQ